jgi:galactokinase/mevalonate kinase-like predicted kinase
MRITLGGGGTDLESYYSKYGGFLMFYCVNHSKSELIEAMQKKGLKWERFHFDFGGAKILVNT